MFFDKKCLEGRKRMKDRSIIARYRCGNETRGSQYWRQEEDRRCRIEIRVRLQRRVRVKVLTECEQTKNGMQMREFLREEGKGLEIMKMIEKARKEVEKREIAKTKEDFN